MSKEINDIEKCKNCMSINFSGKCDSVETKYLEPVLNFPCKYYIDRGEFIQSVRSKGNSSFTVNPNK